jgi:phage terminase large subunit-like protein
VPPEPFTVEHFDQFARLAVYDDGEQRAPQDWQLALVADLFAGFSENWWIIPEGNGKSTFVALLALYGAHFSESPWIPIGAASAKQARIIYDQAEGFVKRTTELKPWFRCFGGYKLIRSVRNGGTGIEVFAHDPKTGDGVIPYPYAFVDELHRHDDLRLYSLWKGKLRKRQAQIVTISTAGEPETAFENTRDTIRRRATDGERDGSHLRATGPGLVLHEWMVAKDEQCSDMRAVKAANPLWSITEGTLAADFDSPTMDLGDWKRLKCNRPTRSVQTAISDKEWDDSEVAGEFPLGVAGDAGLDVAFKWDTTALVPLWNGPQYRLLGPARIVTPPRDGSSIHPDEIKHEFVELTAGFELQTVVMDTSKAEDLASWIEDEMGVTVVDRQQTNKMACEDYEAVMEGLRNGTLKHVADLGLKSHALNAIARRLPGGDRRFDRPTPSRRSVVAQDRRVIDALTAAGMVVQHSTREQPRKSVYEAYYSAAPA